MKHRIIYNRLENANKAFSILNIGNAAENGGNMCGIAGFFNASLDFTESSQLYGKVLEEMKNSIAHRGPDSEGVRLFRHCGIAHTRLAIIDLLGGIQPMCRKLDGYSYHIVYNGELYNTGRLRKKLMNAGWSFVSGSDTEVILLSFLQYGPEFVNKLDGIFAFAIYDERHETIYLYRDSFGIKPLFYTIKDGTVIFASEPKGLFKYPGVEAILDKDGINEVFGIGPARIPGLGVFKGVYEVKPGCYLTCSRYGIKNKCYWHLKSRPHEDSYEKTIEKTGFLVEDAIKRQMVSDVPICTFLSGGIDSSLVSAVCATELKKKGERLVTYSFDFTGNDKYFQANSFQPSQDRPYVDKMVEFLGSEHHYLECSYETQADLLYASIDAHDLPCMADVDSSLVHFCRQVSLNHKVVLTGECADEVFGGYPWFHKEEFLKSNTFPWTPDLLPRKELIKSDVLYALKMDEFVQRAYENAVSETSLLPWEDETESSRRQTGYLNIRFFMQTLLNRMDRTSMNSGLEARVPFADRKLVEYVFNVPWNMKACDGVVKNLLRQGARGKLPDEILFRRKSPYPKSYNPYYEKLLAERLDVLIEEGDSPLFKIIDIKKLGKFMQSVKDYGKPWYGQLMAGPQMLAYLVQLGYWMKKFNIKIEI